MSESFMVIAPPAAPVDAGTSILWDSTYGLLGTPVLDTQGPYRRIFGAHFKRALVTIFSNQALTFIARTLAGGSTSWRTFNGTGSGEAVAASTLFERDVYLMGDDQQLYVLGSGTTPTTFEVSIKLRAQAALAQ